MATDRDGRNTVIAMWILTGITFAFVVLRVYTRVFVTRSYGMDDNVYILAFIFYVLSNAFVTASAHYGFGQNMADIKNPDDIVQAILWELIGQTFSVFGMALAKWALGFFLLRLVTKMWFKVVIWTAMLCLMSASISVAFVCWLQCTPHNYLWDRRIQGTCPINAIPVSTVLNSATVIVDFIFAGLPWLFIWDLQVKKQEKIVILTTMTLGIAAAACGIKRAEENSGLASPNYLKDTVPLIFWSAIEHAVTLICIGIAVCRPLYKDSLRRFISTLSDHRKTTNRVKSYKLDEHSHDSTTSKNDQGVHGKEAPTGADINNSAAAITQWRPKSQNNWDDQELLVRDNPAHGNSSIPDRSIRVTEEYMVSRQV